MDEITLIHGDCLEEMKKIPDKSIDLVVTSPPYDNLRSYNNLADKIYNSNDYYMFDFQFIAREIFRVIKLGGVLVWVVGDQVVGGSETGTSFRQALYFKEIGFNLHDTMIYQKNSYPYPMSNRYYQVFEYMFVLSSGKPKTANLLKQPNLWKQKNKHSSTTRKRDGSTEHLKYETGKEERTKDNVWKYDCGYMRSSKDKIAFQHPATFPEALAQDHILTWSNKGDMVLDPMMGSGTVGKMAKLNNRNFIGIEIDPKYFEIAKRRIENTMPDMFVKLNGCNTDCKGTEKICEEYDDKKTKNIS